MPPVPVPGVTTRPADGTGTALLHHHAHAVLQPGTTTTRNNWLMRFQNMICNYNSPESIQWPHTPGECFSPSFLPGNSNPINFTEARSKTRLYGPGGVGLSPHSITASPARPAALVMRDVGMGVGHSPVPAAAMGWWAALLRHPESHRGAEQCPGRQRPSCTQRRHLAPSPARAVVSLLPHSPTGPGIPMSPCPGPTPRPLFLSSLPGLPFTDADRHH